MSGDDQLRKALRRIPAFSKLGLRDLNLLLGILQPVVIDPLSVIFREGQAGTSCFILLRGKIYVDKRVPGLKPLHVAHLRAGALVGHLELIDGRPFSATYQTMQTRAHGLLMQRADFNRLYDAGTPLAFDLMDWIIRDLAGRLRSTTDRLRELSEAPTASGRYEVVSEAARTIGGEHAPYMPDLSDEELNSVSFTAVDWGDRNADKKRRP